MISPALKEFKPRSEKPSKRCSKMRVRGVVRLAPRVGPASALITTKKAGDDPRVCVARPLSQAGLVNQAAVRAKPGRLPLVSGPGGDPRPCCLLVSASGGVIVL